MSRLKCKMMRRIMAVALSIAMLMSNMTVYAEELSGSKTEPQTEETVEETPSETSETDAEEQPSGAEEKTTAESKTTAEEETLTEKETQTETEEVAETETATEKADSEESSAVKKTKEDASSDSDNKDSGIQTTSDGTRTIDVWDFAAVQQTDTADLTYTNNITAQGWIDKKSLFTEEQQNGTGTGKWSLTKDETIVFGDLTIHAIKADRLCVDSNDTTGMKDFAYETGKHGNTYSDGYVSKGAYHPNGTGTDTKRCVTIANVKAGDKIVAYVGSTNSDVYYHFACQETDSNQNDKSTAVANGKYEKVEFIAKYDGAYKIYPEGGKPLYNRIVRVPGVAVSGSIKLNGATLPAGYGIEFVNQSDKSDKITADINTSNNTYTATLAPGFTYKASLTSAVGYGIDQTTEITTQDKDYKNGKTFDIAVKTMSTYKYSGKITGFDSDYDISNLVVRMVPSADAETKDEVELDIKKEENGELTFGGVCCQI